MMAAIADLFPPRIARTIIGQSIDWLRSQRAHVLQMAEQCGVDQSVVASEIDRLIDASEPTPPTDNPSVDVVVPFWNGDACYLLECLEGLAAQRHVYVIAHVVADGCQFPDLSTLESQLSTLRYSTCGGWGPYRICNSLVLYGQCRAEFLAIHDADDRSYPDRLWRQIAMLRSTGADMISSAMLNFPQGGQETIDVVSQKFAWQKELRPGKTYESVPRGHCVNPTRTMRREFFLSRNGFADIHCSGDFDFDNRCRYSDAKILDDQTILGDRRVHVDSLSHGLVPMGSPARQVAMSQVLANLRHMQRNASAETAKRLGQLHLAQPLEVLK